MVIKGVEGMVKDGAGLRRGAGAIDGGGQPGEAPTFKEAPELYGKGGEKLGDNPADKEGVDGSYAAGSDIGTTEGPK